MVFSFQGKDGASAAAPQDQKAAKSSRKDYSDHAKMKPQDWEHAFDTLLELHLINVPPNFY